MMTVLRTETQKQRWLAVELAKTWRKHPHAFSCGCGKVTMVHWWHDATGVWREPSELRRFLVQHCAMSASSTGHKTFDVPITLIEAAEKWALEL